MKQLELSHEFRTHLVEKARQRTVRNLAISLMAMLHINPDGRELVAICGSGDERNNAEAIHHWLGQETCCASCIRTCSFKALQKNFLNFLIDVTGQYPEGL